MSFNLQVDLIIAYSEIILVQELVVLALFGICIFGF